MPNWNSNTMTIHRIDKGKLTLQEIGAFIREVPEEEADQKINDKYYKFSYQYVVPSKQDDSRWENNINAWNCKRDGFCGDGYIGLNDYEITIDWSSPWGPPNKWLYAVCKKFPELYINLAYDEPGMCFQGEMGRNEKGELFDNYREGDEYLHECYGCGFNLKDVTYREDVQDLLCDACYQELLNHNPPKKGGK